MSATYAALAEPAALGGSARPAVSSALADALSRLVLPVAFASALSIVPNANTSVRQGDEDYIVIYASDSATFNAQVTHLRSISELGWTPEQAAAMRHKLSAFADDWNDPAMDVYDAL